MSASINRKIFLTLIHHLYIHLLSLHHFLLQYHLSHIPPAFYHFVWWLISFLLLLPLLLQLQLSGLILLLLEILSFLIVFDLLFNLCDESWVQFFLPFDLQLQILYLSLNFLNNTKSTVMAFFMIFSLEPSMFSPATLSPISLKISTTRLVTLSRSIF